MKQKIIQVLRVLLARLLRSWQPSRALVPSGEQSSTGVLTVTDSRTDQKYVIPIVENAIRATDFKAIQEGKSRKGLKIFDPGFFNTACTESKLTYMSVNSTTPS